MSEESFEEWFNNDAVECRGDEDCDHCSQVSASYYAKQYLNKPEIIKIMEK